MFSGVEAVGVGDGEVGLGVGDCRAETAVTASFLGGGGGWTSLPRGPAKLEDMNCVGGGGDAEEGGGSVEGHAVDARGHTAAAELIELLGRGDGEDADDSAFIRGGGEQGAGAIKGDAGEGRAVGFGHVDGFEFEGVVEEDVAACWGDVSASWRGVRRGSKGCGKGLLGEGVGEVAIVGRGRKGADG